MFQSNAFQSFAFQTVGNNNTQTGGHFLPVYLPKKHKKQPLGNVIFIYDKVKEAIEEDELQLEDVNSLSSSLQEFVELPIISKLPAAETIDFAAMNEAAMQRFTDILHDIQQRLQILDQDMQDDELLFMLATIN